MTEYRKRADGTVAISTDLFKAANRNTSFPSIPTEDNCDSVGWDIVQTSTPPAVTPPYEIFERDGVEESGGKWVEKYKITTRNTSEVDTENANLARSDRDRLLSESDWTQAADTALSNSKKAEWVTYRTALRDLPTASGWPHTHTLPTKPS
jgi:hypothetical protein